MKATRICSKRAAGPVPGSGDPHGPMTRIDGTRTLARLGRRRPRLRLDSDVDGWAWGRPSRRSSPISPSTTPSAAPWSAPTAPPPLLPPPFSQRTARTWCPSAVQCGSLGPPPLNRARTIRQALWQLLPIVAPGSVQEQSNLFCVFSSLPTVASRSRAIAPRRRARTPTCARACARGLAGDEGPRARRRRRR